MQRCMYKCVLLFKGHLKCFSTPCRVSRLNMVMSRTGYNALLCHVILHNDRTELTCVMLPTIKCVIEVMSMVTCLEKWEKNTSLSGQLAGGMGGACSRWRWRQLLYLLQMYELHRCFPKQMPHERQNHVTDPDSLSVSTSLHMKPPPESKMQASVAQIHQITFWLIHSCKTDSGFKWQLL